MTNPNAKILIVDDVAGNRDFPVRRLTRLDFSQIDQAENGTDPSDSMAAILQSLEPNAQP